MDDNGISSPETSPTITPSNSPPGRPPRSSPSNSPPDSFSESESDMSTEDFLQDEDLGMDDDNRLLSEELFDPLYPGATITICGAYCAIMHFATQNPGATITICGAYCAIMHFATQNKLPYTAIEQLLPPLQLICPQPNSLPKSFYKLKKFFKEFGAIYDRTEFCTTCNARITSQSSSTSTHSTCHGRGQLVHVHLDKATTLTSDHYRMNIVKTPLTI